MTFYRNADNSLEHFLSLQTTETKPPKPTTTMEKKRKRSDDDETDITPATFEEACKKMTYQELSKLNKVLQLHMGKHMLEFDEKKATSERNIAVEKASIGVARDSALREIDDRVKLRDSLLKDNADALSDVVKISLRGKIYQASKKCLLSHDGSYFVGMLGSETSRPTEDGIYFINRNPKHFDTVLDFLTDGSLSLEGLSSVQVEELRCEFDSYLVYPDALKRDERPLLPLVMWKTNDDPDITLSNGCLTANYKYHSEFSHLICSIDPANDFEIVVTSEGVGPKKDPIYCLVGFNNGTHKWYLSCGGDEGTFTVDPLKTELVVSSKLIHGDRIRVTKEGLKVSFTVNGVFLHSLTAERGLPDEPVTAFVCISDSTSATLLNA